MHWIRELINHSKLQYYKRKYQFKYPDAYPKPYNLLNIDPNKVTHKGKNADFQNKPPIFGILDGEWDLKKIPHDKDHYSTYKLLYDRFVNKKEWEEIDVYQKEITRIRKGEKLGRLDGVNSVGKYKNYHRYLDGLFDSISTDGYQTQEELAGNDDFLSRRPNFFNNISVNIGRDGEITKDHGGHRLIIAKLVGVEQIPVRVRIRHKEWQKTRSNAVKYPDELHQNDIDPHHPDLREFNLGSN